LPRIISGIAQDRHNRPTHIPSVNATAEVAERAAFDRLVKAGVVTGRKPTTLAVLRTYRAKRPLRRYLIETDRIAIPEVWE